MLPTTTITANGTGGLLKNIVSRTLFLEFSVSAVPTGGSPTLDVYFQHSCDQGTTWRDLGHFGQFTTSTATNFMSISGVAAGAVTALAASDAALAANTVVQGPYGDQLRLRWVYVAGNSGSYTVNAFLTQKI